MLIGNEIFQKLHIPFFHLIFEFSERDTGGIDNGGFTAEMVDQTDPSLTVKNFDMIGRRHIQVFHNLTPFKCYKIQLHRNIAPLLE